MFNELGNKLWVVEIVSRVHSPFFCQYQNYFSIISRLYGSFRLLLYKKATSCKLGFENGSSKLLYMWFCCRSSMWRRSSFAKLFIVLPSVGCRGNSMHASPACRKLTETSTAPLKKNRYSFMKVSLTKTLSLIFDVSAPNFLLTKQTRRHVLKTFRTLEEEVLPISTSFSCWFLCGMTYPESKRTRFFSYSSFLLQVQLWLLRSTFICFCCEATSCCRNSDDRFETGVDFLEAVRLTNQAAPRRGKKYNEKQK